MAVEYLYTTVQKGTPKENWLFVKMKTDGTVVQKITAPPEAGFQSAKRVAADGSGTGAGWQHLHRQWLWGLTDLQVRQERASTRRATPGRASTEWFVRLQPWDERSIHATTSRCCWCATARTAGCVISTSTESLCETITQHLRRPCQVSFYGDYAVVSELEGRVTILDKDNAPVAFLGDNPQKTQWANYQIPAR